MVALIIAVLFYQEVEGVLAPSGATSSSLPISTRVPWGMIQERSTIGVVVRLSVAELEDEGGEGRTAKGKRGHPWGVEVFTTPLWTQPSLSLFLARESESEVCLFCDLLWFWQIFGSSFSDTMWSGRKAETCYECLRGENKYKFVVLSFEKAWDKIQRDIIKCKPCKNVDSVNSTCKQFEQFSARYCLHLCLVVFYHW